MSYIDSEIRFLNVAGTPFAYKVTGSGNKTPLVLLHHLAATLDNWDPALVDQLAQDRAVITFDNRGIGASGGKTPLSVKKMGQDARAFIDVLVKELGVEQVDVLGLSLGGFVLQELMLSRPSTVRRIAFAGTGPASGNGISKVPVITFYDMFRGARHHKDPKYFLFFPDTAGIEADAFLSRLGTIKVKDAAIRVPSFLRQLVAVYRWGAQKEQNLSSIIEPALVVNGETDRMVPSENTLRLAEKLPNARLMPLYPGAGHGGIFQENELFAQQLKDFLDA